MHSSAVVGPLTNNSNGHQLHDHPRMHFRIHILLLIHGHKRRHIQRHTVRVRINLIKDAV